MSMSQLPPQNSEFGRTIERLVGTSGFPWWWHTRDDTIDKIDPAVLALDTRVYAAAALRLCNAPVLPLAPARAARAVAQTADELHAAAGGQFDLSPVVEAALGLADALAVHDGRLARLAADPAAAEEATRSSRALMRLSRALVPLLYTTGDRFAHDLAVGIPPLAGLAPARALREMDPASDLARFTLAALVRERNRVLHALDEAMEEARALGPAPGRA
jgi:N-acetylated-alpha-linked acidic dipeptidase